MILIFGMVRDSGIAYLLQRLLERRERFVVLDSRRFPQDFQLDWQSDGRDMEGSFSGGGQTIDLTEVRSIYVHHLFPPERAEGRESFAMLHGFLNAVPRLVCNRPSASMTNFSKTYQQQIIARHGFLTPRTLVTNVPDEARAFYDQCGRRVIYKSLSGLRSIVRRMTDADLDRLEHVRGCPTQFQQWVPGVDIRVHVVGSRVFPTEVITEAVDYRYAGRDGLARAMRGTELPEQIARRCMALAADLSLCSTGIDLRRGLDGRYWCFEANPTPAFAFYQQYTGQRIGDALADMLIRGTVLDRGDSSSWDSRPFAGSSITGPVAA